jgi:hypothetical protein
MTEVVNVETAGGVMAQTNLLPPIPPCLPPTKEHQR